MVELPDTPKAPPEYSQSSPLNPLYIIINTKDTGRLHESPEGQNRRSARRQSLMEQIKASGTFKFLLDSAAEHLISKPTSVV